MNASVICVAMTFERALDRPNRRRGRVAQRLSSIVAVRRKRELELEGASLAGSAVHPDAAPVSFDDALGDVEAEAGSSPAL